MNLEELLKETDALTVINSLKVTLTQIKDEVNTMEELQEYQQQAGDRVRKLMRRADGQYRLIAKLAQKDAPVASDLVVDDETDQELEELMEQSE